MFEFPAKRTLLQIPQRGPVETVAHFQSFFYKSLGFPNKQGLLISQNHTFILKSQAKQPPLPAPLPQRGPFGEELPFPEPSLQVTPQSPHTERRSFSRALFYCSNSPIKESLLQIPQWGPYGERCPSPELRVRSRGALPRFPRSAPIEKDVLFSEPSLTCLTEPAVRETPSRFPSGAPMKRDARSRAFIFTSLGTSKKKNLLIKQHLTFLSKSPVRELPFHFPPTVPL